MRGVLATPPAVLLKLQAVRVVLLVLDSRVVPALAIAALESDDRFHFFSALVPLFSPHGTLHRLGVKKKA